MYALNLPSNTYHLVQESGGRTLCGLIVVPIVIDRPVITTALYLTANKPDDRSLCQDCARADLDDAK